MNFLLSGVPPSFFAKKGTVSFINVSGITGDIFHKAHSPDWSVPLSYRYILPGSSLLYPLPRNNPANEIYVYLY